MLQYVDQYAGGVAGFVARARELADRVRRAVHAAGVAGRPGRPVLAEGGDPIPELILRYAAPQLGDHDVNFMITASGEGG